MAIKLKKYESDSGVLNRLYSKAFRITAIILACVFWTASALEICYAQSLGVYDGLTDDYTYSEEYHDAVMDEYEQLCIYAACYLNNVDSKWNFIGEKNLLSDFLYYLDYNGYKYKKTDEGIIPVSDMFDFYVSFQDNDGEIRYLTNIEFGNLRYDEMSDDNRVEWLKSNLNNYILRRNNVITSDKVSSSTINTYYFPDYQTGYYNGDLDNYVDYGYYDEEGYYNQYYYTDNELKEESYADNFVPIGGWFYDNFGRYFYNFGNEEPIRFFSNDKNTKDGKIARNGCLYLIYTDDGNEFYVSNSEDIEMYENYSWSYLEDLDTYKAYEGEDEGITVFISPKSDVIEKNAAVFKTLVQDYRNSRFKGICFAAAALLFTVYVVAACGFSGVTDNGISWKKSRFFGKLSSELYFLCDIAAFICLLVVFDNYYDIMTSEFIGYKNVSIIVCTSLFFLFSFIGMGCLIQLTEKIKTHNFVNDMLVVSIYRKIKRAYKESDYYQSYQQRSMGEKLSRRSIAVLAACGSVVLSFFLTFLWNDEFIFIAVSAVAIVVVAVNGFRNIRDFRDLRKISRQINALGTNEAVDVDISPKSAMYNDSVMLTQISEKVSNSVEEQIKSERMKIELVANVSHDLKTPLTSIISYIDLLKKLELDEEADCYVKIIDKKAQKLKNIVADVFSLAKATSGIDVNLAKIDFVTLFNQALADADDKIRESGKIVKTTINEMSAPVMADGDKMYRVFQNLVDNALNYSLEGSRIFLEVRKSGDNIQFISKNISASPIDFTEDEIVERFVRGDKSRTDGGSGLGLSIAKSFTEACGGDFRIILDGDMFKTVVSMPVLTDEPQINDNSSETE